MNLTDLFSNFGVFGLVLAGVVLFLLFNFFFGG